MTGNLREGKCLTIGCNSANMGYNDCRGEPHNDFLWEGPGGCPKRGVIPAHTMGPHETVHRRQPTADHLTHLRCFSRETVHHGR